MVHGQVRKGLTTMLNFAINNEAIQGGVPIPLLTTNSYTGDMTLMAKSSIPKKQSRKQDYIGRKFGRLTILEEVSSYIDPKSQKKIRMVKCQCSCGCVVETRLNALISKKTKSCGCLATERRKAFATKHNYCGHPLYRVWQNMKDRCYNKKNLRYKHYGDRGIFVCTEWINNPKVFIEWALNNGWESTKLLDRRNNDLGYEPSNCRFVDVYKSNQNTSLLRTNNTSGYRGVCFDKARNLWSARIDANGKTFNLGRFKNAIDAAKICDSKIKELGLEQPLNFA